MATDQVFIGVYVPPQLAAEIRELARVNDRSVSAELRIAIQARLDAVRAVEDAAYRVQVT